MKKLTYLIVSLLFASLISAQNGNTINDAILIDGLGVFVNALDFNSATQSGLSPTCGSTEDVFYRHDVSPSDNKIKIGMASAGVSLLTSIEYQILVAPNGDINNLQLVTCDSYSVLLVAGGSFELIIENINDTDVYYLRVHRPSGLGGALNDLLNGTSVTMTSEFDATLYLENKDYEKFKFMVKDGRIKMYNNTYNKMYIYGLNGKTVFKKINDKALTSINISHLNKGIYILSLEKENRKEVFKFVHH